jgi:acyl carrier protein
MSKIESILKNIKPEVDFNKSQDFVEDGLLDSLELIELIEGIEEEYQIEIDPMDILPENFSSISQIEAVIVKAGGELE